MTATPTAPTAPTPAEPATTPGGLLTAALAGQRRRVGGAAVLFMSWQACEALVPVAIGAVIQQAITTRDGSRMLLWVLALGALFWVLSWSFRFASRLARGAMEYAGHALRLRITRAVLDPGRLPDRTHRAGTTVAIAGSDVDRLAELCRLAPRVAGAVVSVLIATVVLVGISVPLGLLVLLGAPVLLVLVHLLGVPLERRSGTEQEQSAGAAALATDLMDGLRVLKGFGGERAAARRYRSASRTSMAASVRAAGAETVYESAAALATVCFLALVALVGGRLAAQGRIGVGDLVAAVGLAQFLIGPLSGLASVGAALSRARASARRIAAVLSAPRRPASGRRLPRPVRGELVVAVGDARLRLAPGELLGLVAGTAEAAELVDRLATAPYSTDAAVRVDGLAVGDLALADAGAALLVARHDERLFAGSVRENVCGAGPVDDRVRAALAASAADQVAQTLPHGLDTAVAERGGSLSGGQRQRVLLARALVADPPILVLHDPTTAVDAATEAHLAAGLASCRRGRTTLLVASSPALLARCDRVVHLDGGRLSTGRHAELLARDAGYRERVLA